jgi:hypothetical protein
MNYRVENLSLEQLNAGEAQLFVACAGYETRAPHFITAVRAAHPGDSRAFGSKLILLEHAALRDMPSRHAVDAVFEGFSPSTRMAVTGDSGDDVLAAVRAAVRPGAPVVVDYTVMSRLLYLPLLDLVREGHELIFAYSVGRYPAAGPYPISYPGDIRPVPGLGGTVNALKPKLHVFGLGYDGVGAQGLALRLEANNIIVFWADPGASDGAAATTESANAPLIKRAVASFRVPLGDVAATTSLLRRIAVEARPSDRVVFVPIGPKPHVLASALASLGLEHTVVLAPHLGGGGIREKHPDISAAGDVILTRVTGATS